MTEPFKYKVSAVILAAGLARRAAGPKAVWPVGGLASVRRVAEAALAAPGLDQVAVVTGAWAEEVRSALTGLPVTLVHNPDYASGQAGSLKAGLASLPAETGAAVFLLADQPFITSQIIGDLVEFKIETGAGLVAPWFEGRRRNPVVFDLYRFGPELAALKGDLGGREIIAAHPGELALYPADGRAEAKCFDDFDTMEDYERLQTMTADTGADPRPLVFIRGAGDLASGVAHRLHRAGYRLLMSDLDQPTAIRRTVAFSQAVYDGEMTLEGVTAQRSGLDNYEAVQAAGRIPVVTGVDQDRLDQLGPRAFIEATLSKRNLGVCRREGRVTLALGPGYSAGLDVDAVVETARGHFLGRLILEGPAKPNSGVPGIIGGYGLERLLRAPAEGEVYFSAVIGQSVEKGQVIGRVGGTDITATITGVVRGALPNGLTVPQGFKIGDIDPRPEAAGFIQTPSDKARAVAGGVLEGLLYFGLPPR